MTMALFPETLFRMMEKQNNELEKGGNFWNLFGRKEKRGSNVEKRGNIYRRGLNPFKGEIAVLAFTFCPTGWAATNGELLPIQANAALFSLIGTNYGGDGVNAFALPTLTNFRPDCTVYSHRNHDIPLLGALPPGQLFTSYSCWDSRSMPNTVILVLVGASISGHTVARSVVHKTDCVTQDRLNNTSSPQYIHADSQIFFHRGFGCAVSFASSAASSSSNSFYQ